MLYTAKNYDALLGTPGFSDQLLKNHFTLYQGYVTNVNKLSEILTAMLNDGRSNTPEFAETKRRFGWEFNGMRLHELYFGNMSKNGSEPIASGSKLYEKIIADFGSFESWEKDFKAVGMMRGIGWAILYHDKEADRLFNVWINEHDVGHFAGCVPLLVLDVFEHAFMLDYGTKRADYITAFMKAIDWGVSEGRLTA
ncbi:MAG: Fe-Mn family superoxide dismutase [Candidatus Magasanikbacteria bacterium]|nr:Fe-Mn family superoxide dismutase [Candidatus Magasanikbacteria bacterium]